MRFTHGFVRKGCAGQLKITMLLKFLPTDLHFMRFKVTILLQFLPIDHHSVRNGCRGACKIATLPQLLPIKPHSVRDGCISWRPQPKERRLKEDVGERKKDRQTDRHREREREGGRVRDVKTWRCEDVKMRRWWCADEKMRRCEDDMGRCEDVKIIGADVMMRRCEDVKMRRVDVKKRGCEGERMIWGGVKMRGCEDVKMYNRPPLFEEPTLRSGTLGKNYHEPINNSTKHKILVISQRFSDTPTMKRWCLVPKSPFRCTSAKQPDWFKRPLNMLLLIAVYPRLVSGSQPIFC